MNKNTSSMEAFFNLPPAEQDIEITQEEFIPTKDRNELMSEAKEIFNSLSTIEKIDIALPVVEDLKEHNAEMDEISKRAIKSFEDLMELGGNIPDMHAGKIFEVAGVMLKTAMEAKNAKAEKKLRMIELQIKKARLDQLGGNEGSGNGNTVPSGEFDRNELLKHIIDASKSENSDK